MAESSKKHIGIIPQIAILFLVGTLLIGVLTYFSQRAFSDANIRMQTETRTGEIVEEISSAVKEYPSYRWLLRYWYEHADKLDIEYDVDFSSGTKTEAKSREFEKRNPDLQIRYVTAEELMALPEEDQKLYSEIVYSWLITRINQIKKAYNIDYLFCVLTNPPYDHQFFLFSAGDGKSKRGKNYEEVYVLGTESDVNASQQAAMEDAVKQSMHLADAGGYVDYYGLLDEVDGHQILIGLTYSLSVLTNDIDMYTNRQTLFTVFYLIALAGILLGMIWQMVLRPLKKVQESIRNYKRTKNSALVKENLADVRAGNEIGILAKDVVSMTKEMDDYLHEIETITSEKERISTEMSLAARIQSHTLPSQFPPFPERKEFDIYASMDPAKEVGGDFYDFYLIDDDHVGFLIADVSGKGVPAALFMMISMLLIHTGATNSLSPAEVLANVNEKICDHNPEEMFVTVWMGILEISTGKLTAANAGHEYPFIKHANGQYEMLKDKHGFVIGGMEGVKYHDYEIQLEAGSKIFVYTDGLPEATNSESQLFGTDRICEVLNKEPDASIKKTLDNMNEAVDEFVKEEEQFDDLTMLCFIYHGTEE